MKHSRNVFTQLCRGDKIPFLNWDPESDFHPVRDSRSGFGKKLRLTPLTSTHFSRERRRRQRRESVAAVVHSDRRAQGRDARPSRHAEHPLAGAAGQGRGPLLRQRRQLQEGVRVVQGAGGVTALLQGFYRTCGIRYREDTIVNFTKCNCS